MIVSLETSQEDVDRLVAAEARKLIAKTMDLESLRMVKTSTAAALLEMNEKSFLLLAKARGLKPKHFGPRMKRWRYTDLKALLEEPV